MRVQWQGNGRIQWQSSRIECILVQSTIQYKEHYNPGKNTSHNTKRGSAAVQKKTVRKVLDGVVYEGLWCKYMVMDAPTTICSGSDIT